MRLGDIEQIKAQASAIGVPVQTQQFESDEAWQDFAVTALIRVQAIARELGIEDRLHLWLTKSLTDISVIQRQPKRAIYRAWIKYWSKRVSQWPE